MADVMPPLPQGPQEGAGALENFKKNRSLANPLDLAMMQQEGSISPDSTIAEFFQSTFGLDVNTDTITDMIQATKKNIQNADPVKKMGNIAQGAGPGMGQPAPPPQGAPPGPPKGLADLATL